MTVELYWLTLTCLLTSIMWVPYILNRSAVRGLLPAMGNPRADDLPHSDWADRAMRAHANAIENLVIFAEVVLIAHAAGISTSLTATGAMLFFFLRLAHWVIYIIGIPYLRTLIFAASWFILFLMILTVLGWI